MARFSRGSSRMTRHDDDDAAPSLRTLLECADLVRYEDDMRNVLRLRHAGDLQYVDEVDLCGIGMSRPEQKRLRHEYGRLCKSGGGVLGKLKKVFVRNETSSRTAAASAENDDQQQQHVIPISQITLTRSLGAGEFGAVHQATWRSAAHPEGTQVAVKVVPAARLRAQLDAAHFLAEAAVMARARHEHIVRLHGVVLETDAVMLVSELAACGSLLECLRKPALRDSFAVGTLCEYARQVAAGMAYLESRRLIHRDLAARNVLVCGPKLVKISDFGLSRSLGVGQDYYRSEYSPALRLPIAWCAPECINYLKFTSASDVWAYGVTLWEVFAYGATPFDGMSGAQILRAVDEQRRRLERPVACPDDMWELALECWTHEPERRPTFAAIVATFADRVPQTLRAIRNVDADEAAHLRLRCGELISVLCRRPDGHIDGAYWRGATRSGAIGLFKPSDTVAQLKADAPSAAAHAEPKTTTAKRKPRPDISEPQGDLRHVCHIGADGSAVGLLQMDKKALAAGAALAPANAVQPSAPPLSLTREQVRALNGDKSLDDAFTDSLRVLHEATSDPPSPPAPSRNAQRARSPVCAVYARRPHSATQPQSSSSSSCTEQELIDRVARLDRELTDYTLAQLDDMTPSVRLMRDAEMQKFRDDRARHHGEVTKRLSADCKTTLAQKASSTGDVSTAGDAGRHSLRDWSAEAQQAYKLLVECGDELSAHSADSCAAASSSSNGGCRVEAVVPVHKCGSDFIVRPALPPKTYRKNGGAQHNAKPPELPPRRVPAPTAGGYDNVQRATAKQVPPPVPPKPKVALYKDATHFHAGEKIEEVIKF